MAVWLVLVHLDSCLGWDGRSVLGEVPGVLGGMSKANIVPCRDMLGFPGLSSTSRIPLGLIGSKAPAADPCSDRTSEQEDRDSNRPGSVSFATGASTRAKSHHDL